ncbi:phage tail spike protein [Streptococcus suis]|uniref:Putative antireceptor n=1 Tax=Streptococcus suis TaxID=1307 RepID=A0A116LKR8_STRSU|nr:phage tail spike protein [Streptococcus suis]NQH51401.1 hypothetical protein [Streptococcus suis]CYU97981.1 putative antireceptor [Streptococcus suis]
MICLYAADESLFEHNGLGILDNDLKKCHVEEELNNLYTLTALYPLGAKFGKSIRNGMIIKAPTPNGDQLFRIYQSKPSMGMLEVHAFHVFYDLAFNFIEDTNIVSKSGQAWLQQLSQNTQYRHPFTFFSDISTVAGSRVVRKNCVEILLNTSLDNSFVNRFGGEILRDNFKVYFNRAIGENRGFKIRHKKNLKGYTANIDDKSVITRIMPIGFDGLLLPEKYVDSPRISDYPFPRIGKVEVDVKAAVGENADAKDAIPLNEAHAKMRSLVREQFGLIDVPTCSYEIDFVELSKTKEYADFQNLETVRIGDTVTVSHDEDGFYVEAKVIRYEYDSLAGSLLRIEAGQFESRSSNNSINQQRSIEQQLEDVKIETSNMVQVAANGKNTIYRGIDRPANANVGDLWYEPIENSVVLKQWSGTDWGVIPISDQNLGNVNVNNLSGNHIDVRQFRLSANDTDILYINEQGEVVLNAQHVRINFEDVATKKDLEKIELTPGPQGPKGDPGPKGADGRTSYSHWAYSDNADGTGLSTSDNGQRYIGHYSDYVQADSTDKTKYSWADRWAKIEVGGQNLFYKKNRHRGRYFNDIGALVYSEDYDTSQFIDLKAGVEYILQAWGTEGTWVGWALFDQSDVFKKYETRYLPGDGYLVEKITFKEATKISIGYDNRPTNLKIKLERGSVPTDWSLALEDWQSEIDSKADQALTQEQLNALNEQAGIIQAELEAKASMDTVSKWFAEFRKFVEDNATDKSLSEQNLIALTQRVVGIDTNLGSMAQRWSFLDTYMKAGNEGLVIGKNDGSSSVRLSDNRISFYSAGQEVAYISNGVLQIDNGVFTRTLQIGRFREEQYHLNADTNVVRYVY